MKKILTVFASLSIIFALCIGYAHAIPLVYDPGTDGTIQTAMTSLGYSPFDLRDASAPVTAADLTTHEILVVGWNYLGDMSGLPAAILDAGITGNILLTGHDADYHTVWGPAAAATFLDQAITWALSGGGTSLVALGDYSTAFGYLPAGWGVSAVGGLTREPVTDFTPEGLASGVYTGLIPADMSSWGNSYHAIFTAWGPEFRPFELFEQDLLVDVVTIGSSVSVPEPTTLLLIGSGLIASAVFRRRFRKS